MLFWQFRQFFHGTRRFCCRKCNTQKRLLGPAAAAGLSARGSTLSLSRGCRPGPQSAAQSVMTPSVSTWLETMPPLWS